MLFDIFSDVSLAECIDRWTVRGGCVQSSRCVFGLPLQLYVDVAFQKQILPKLEVEQLWKTGVVGVGGGGWDAVAPQVTHHESFTHELLHDQL
jgi:hypothetical protein